MNAHERAEKLCREAESTGLDNPTEGMIADAFSDMEFNHQQEVSRLRKALAEARKDSAWQPIETAPKDGTWIQGWKEHGDQWIPKMRWNVPYRTWEFRNGGQWMHLFADRVTHWMPLPTTPLPETEGTI